MAHDEPPALACRVISFTRVSHPLPEPKVVTSPLVSYVREVARREVEDSIGMPISRPSKYTVGAGQSLLEPLLSENVTAKKIERSSTQHHAEGSRSKPNIPQPLIPPHPQVDFLPLPMRDVAVDGDPEWRFDFHKLRELPQIPEFRGSKNSSALTHKGRRGEADRGTAGSSSTIAPAGSVAASSRWRPWETVARLASSPSTADVFNNGHGASSSSNPATTKSNTKSLTSLPSPTISRGKSVARNPVTKYLDSTSSSDSSESPEPVSSSRTLKPTPFGGDLGSQPIEKPTLPRVYVQDACLRHRWIRTRDKSNVFERPERLRAVKIGVAAAYAHLEFAAHSEGTNPGPSGSIATVKPPFDIVRSMATLNMREHPASYHVHGGGCREPERGPSHHCCWTYDLANWCEDSKECISRGESEIPDYTEQDLYCEYSLLSMPFRVTYVSSTVSAM